MGRPHQGTQAMVPTPGSTPPLQPARGGGYVGRGHPKGGGYARYYAFPSRTKTIISDAVITGIVPVCHTYASVLFDPRSTYSYVSSYFASYLDMSRGSLNTLVYVSTPVGDSIVVKRVYRSFLITIGAFETWVDLMFLYMVDFDVILDMKLVISVPC
ncbi:uncharacterized protein [Nicotiana tomentosiformis]|uniref:uncharacterized protein n=1 Tax=Nicotiana tomentosiformis TaxID=4098 RepID=UPI00388C577A